MGLGKFSHLMAVMGDSRVVEFKQEVSMGRARGVKMP